MNKTVAVAPEQAVAFRLTRHHLHARAPRRQLSIVVRDVVGLQSQVANAAYVSLWARVAGVTPADIDGALYQKRTLIRTWAMRGTVHLIARDDLPLVTVPVWYDPTQRVFAAASGAAAPVIPTWLARRGLTDERYRILRKAILEALADGPRTRSELHVAIEASLPGARRFIGSWGGVLRLLAREGLVVFGLPRGQETTFVRRDRWWPNGASPAGRFTSAELMRRYLHGYGPATVADFCYWAGQPVPVAQSALAELGDETAMVSVEGMPAMYVLREDLATLRRMRPVSSVRLLPNFDTFLLGHRDKTTLVDPQHYKAIYREAGWISQTILVHGQAAGTWTSRQRGKTLEIRLAPFGRLARPVRTALRAEAESLARFLGAAHLKLKS